MRDVAREEALKAYALSMVEDVAIALVTIARFDFIGR